MVPSGMTSQVHEFEAREGGSFRISLTHDAATGTGKTTAHTDTYHGHFVKLVPKYFCGRQDDVQPVNTSLPLLLFMNVNYSLSKPLYTER